MRYTPGRFGSDAMSSRASNVAGAAGSISEWDEAMVRSGSAHARSFPFEMAGNRLEYALEHGRRDPSGVGVVAAAVIAVEEPRAAFERMARAVPEAVSARRQRKRAQHRIVGDAPQCEDGRAVGQHRELSGEIRIALADLSGKRLVGRRQALHRIGDARG